MQQWDYTIARISNWVEGDKKDIEATLGEYGRQGWELISVIAHEQDNFTLHYFKRPKSEAFEQFTP
jgi:hypothetical protein